jgi:hypothetical protein
MRKLLMSATVTALCAVGSAQATPITYILSGTFNVTVGGNEYDGLDVTLTGTGDTSSVHSVGSETPAVELTSLVASVSGYGDLTLTDPFHFFANNVSSNAGFNNESSFDLVDFTGLGTYDAVSSVSPTSVTFDGGGTTSTPFGTAQVLSGTNMTFSAVLSEGAGAPEPGTWAMMLVGFLGLGAVARRRIPAPVITA